MTPSTSRGRASRTASRQLEIVRQYQSAHCGADFRARYGAIGTAIARRKTDNQGRGGGICLRVLLGVPPGGGPGVEALPRWLTFTRGGVTHRIHVEARRVSEGRAHGATAPVGPGVTSGFCEPHLGGSLGGWAWHDRSCSLVLITCAHVVGRRRRLVTYYDDLTRRVRRAGVVGGSIPILPGGRESVDAAFVHPDPSALRRLAWLERIPPVLAIVAPEIADTTHSRTFRYRRWNAEDGVRAGKIDAVNLNAEVGFMWDESHSTALLEDFVMVRADDGDWGTPTDSGSLVFRREPIARAIHHPVVGVYWGAFHEVDTRASRPMGVACRMDRVARQLGVAPVDAAPLLAFVDWLHGHNTPLDFLRLRRTSNARIRIRRGRAARLVEAIAERGWARSLMAPLATSRHHVTCALARSAPMRERAAHAIGALVRGKSSPEAVFAYAPTRPECAALIALFRSLAEAEPGVAPVMRKLCAVVNDPSRRTVGEMLGGIDDVTGPEPRGARRRRQER